MDTRDPVDEARLLLRQRPDRWRWLAPRRDVFISYAHAKTSTYASNLRAALSSAGISCYLDDLDFREGDSLAKTAVTQIGRARLLLRIEVADDTSTFWMDLEREVARHQGIPVATLALGGRPGDPDELAFTDDPGDEPSADVVVALARRFTLRRWRRGRRFTALAVVVAIAAAIWGLTTPLVAARSLDEVDEATLAGDWHAAATALLGIPERQRSRVWLRYANEVLLGYGTRDFVADRETFPAASVIGVLPNERELWTKRLPAPPSPPSSGVPATYLGHPKVELRVGRRVLAELCWDAGMLGEAGLWAITGTVDGVAVEGPVLGVIDPSGGAGVWRHPLAPGQRWRILVSGDGDWLVLLQGADGGPDLAVLRHHLRSGQTETARWTDAPASWLLGGCATLEGASIVTCDDDTIVEVDFETGRPGPRRPLARNRAAEVVTFGPASRTAVVGAGKVDVQTGERWIGSRYDSAATAEEARFVGDDELAIRFGDGLSSTVVRVGLVPSRAAYLLGREILSNHPDED